MVIRRLDWYQWAAVCVSVAEACVFLAYLFVQEVERKAMISDTLSDEQAYLGSLTAFLGVRLLTVVLFGARYRRELSCTKAWLGVGGAGVCLSLAGWVWLVTQPTDSVGHYSGVGVFSLGTFVYSLALIKLAEVSDPHLLDLHDRFAITLYASSAGLGVLFLSLWLTSNEHAYVVEHMVYLANVLFHACFFLYHSPDPARVVADEYDDYAEPVLACRPLLSRKEPAGINSFL